MCVSKVGHYCFKQRLVACSVRPIFWSTSSLLSIGSLQTTFLGIWIKWIDFISRKWILKRHLHHGGHFVPATMCSSLLPWHYSCKSACQFSGRSGSRLNIHILSYQCRHFHYTDKTFSRLDYLRNGRKYPYLERQWLDGDGVEMLSPTIARLRYFMRSYDALLLTDERLG